MFTPFKRNVPLPVLVRPPPPVPSSKAWLMLIMVVPLLMMAPPLCTLARVRLCRKLAFAPLAATIVPPFQFNVLTLATPVWFALISVAVKTPPLRFKVPLVHPEF